MTDDNTSDAAFEPMEDITVPLRTPLPHGDGKISSLTFSEVEVGHLIEAASIQNEFERLVFMMARSTNVPLDVMKKLKASDMKTIMQKVGGLLGNDPKQAKKTGSE